MFEWFRKLLAGDPGPPPEGVAVERDARGRIVRATATLGAGAGAQGPSPHPRLTLAAASRPALRAASEWLCERNIAAAQRWAIGLERNFVFDQGTARLDLQFEQGPDLPLESQVLGSFDPRDGSFMWAWHNPSLRDGLVQAAHRAREEGERTGDVALTTPVQSARFDDLTPLLAHAAQIAGADGVYRAVNERSTSVFVAYRLPGGPPRLPVDGLDPAFCAEALARAEGFDRDQLEQDRVHHAQAQDDDTALLDRVIDAKMLSWRRDWARDDDYWHPCSTGWPSDHDRASARLHFHAPHPQGGLLDVAVHPTGKRVVYRVERIDGVAKITDRLIGWGDGFVWPRIGG